MTMLSATIGATGAANIMMMRNFALAVPNETAAPGNKTEMVNAYVPRTDVVIAANLATATIKGGRGNTWLTGQSTFTQNKPITDPYSYPCDTDKEIWTQSRQGLINGSLTASLVTGTPIGLGTDLPASAGETEVLAM